MIPILIAFGVGVAIFKSKCSQCGSYMTLNSHCEICGEEVCGECGEDRESVRYKQKEILHEGRYCKNHKQEVEALVAEQRRILDAQGQVETYSKNYKGRVQSPRLGISITTAFYKDRNDAEIALRMEAARHYCQVVTMVEFSKESRSDGNYKYSVWMARGVI